MLRSASSWGVVSLSLILACSSSSNDGTTPDKKTDSKPRYAPTVFGPISDAALTKALTIVPKTARQTYQQGPDPSAPDALADYLKRGFGDFDPGPGDDYVVRSIDGSTPPAPGPNAKRLLRFAHLTDLQLADDESPTRLGMFDSAGSTSSALRPQDAYLCHMTNAAVRTINALHRKDPIAFTLLGGDNADSAQTNELEWALGMLSGADSVECDSGDDDDIIPGPDNDGKDPFKAEGLAMPWKWVTGNHDVLVQGNFPTSLSTDKVLAADAEGGTRFYDNGRLGAVERCEGCVVIDPKRKLMSRQDLMAKVAADKDGHGLGDAAKQSGMGTYTFDADGTPFRFLVMDTAYENGGSEGVMRKSEVDRIIKPSLDKAKADGKWVILASHHAVTSLTDGSSFGSQGKPPDPMTQDEWTALVGGYDNVVFSMVGHSHKNRVVPIKPASGHPWWEVMTSAIADWPHQFRVLEIFDQDNGWLMMRATCVDFSTDGDPVTPSGRKGGIVDFVSGWMPSADGVTDQDKNVEIWIKKPGA